ncbi:MAG: hypothetical protein PVG49_19560 [Desulfobacteraceae bacterium]
MITLLPYILLVAGFVLLIKGADLLVSGASALGRRAGVSDLVIGGTEVTAVEEPMDDLPCRGRVDLGPYSVVILSQDA